MKNTRPVISASPARPESSTWPRICKGEDMQYLH